MNSYARKVVRFVRDHNAQCSLPCKSPAKIWSLDLVVQLASSMVHVFECKSPVSADGTVQRHFLLYFRVYQSRVQKLLACLTQAVSPGCKPDTNTPRAAADRDLHPAPCYDGSGLPSWPHSVASRRSNAVPSMRAGLPSFNVAALLYEQITSMPNEACAAFGSVPSSQDLGLSGALNAGDLAGDNSGTSCCPAGNHHGTACQHVVVERASTTSITQNCFSPVKLQVNMAGHEQAASLPSHDCSRVDLDCL
jgi:hypothetical protein